MGIATGKLAEVFLQTAGHGIARVGGSSGAAVRGLSLFRREGISKPEFLFHILLVTSWTRRCQAAAPLSSQH
jgi:hypothetical protein